MTIKSSGQGQVSSSDKSTSMLPKGTTVNNDAVRSKPAELCKPPGPRNA